MDWRFTRFHCISVSEYVILILAQKAITVVGINCITATGAQNPRMGNFQPVPIRTRHGERQERLKCAARAGAIPAFPLASKRQVQQSLSFGYNTALDACTPSLAFLVCHFLHPRKRLGKSRGAFACKKGEGTRCMIYWHTLIPSNIV